MIALQPVGKCALAAVLLCTKIERVMADAAGGGGRDETGGECAQSV